MSLGILPSGFHLGKRRTDVSASILTSPPTLLQLKLVFVIERIRDQPQLIRI